jgi:galactose mutarotase-like enzyme
MPGAQAPYICLEPWNGLPARADETGHFEDKPYHIEIAPGERFSAGYQMEILIQA